jgi:multidrug efflux pump subunit AcrA (membrane-fusion protein)
VPSADPVSQTTELRLDLPAKESTNLVPGQQVRVRFMGATSNTAVSNKLIVPAAAIVRRGELTAVYVKTKEANPATFALRAVRLGAAQGAAGFEVLAGLRDGETVALEPNRAGFAK